MRGEGKISQLDRDEREYIMEIMKRKITFRDVHLMNKYVLDYNVAHGTDYDWDWLSYPQDEETRLLFEDMIAFGRAKEDAV